jgi:magnesium chelatase family protein
MQNIATAYGSVLVGLEARLVKITATATPNSSLSIIGLPEAAMRETRLRMAVVAHPLNVKVVVHDLPEGVSTAPLDLAIAAAIMRALGTPVAAGPETIFVGALAPDGAVRSVSGVLCRVDTTRPIVVPAENAWEAGLVPGAECYTLLHVHQLRGELARIQPHQLQDHTRDGAVRTAPQFEDLSESLKVAYQASIGHRRLLLVGRPGAGKTILARVIASSMEPLSPEEGLEVAKIYSACGLANALTKQRPFRAPHHTVSETGLIGGGINPRPGEVSLAHRGVLFLDEVLEYTLSRLTSLGSVLRRQDAVLFTRSGAHVKLPAVPAAVIAASNPCPCGYLGSEIRACRCSEEMVRKYQKHLAECAEILGLHIINIT